MQRKNPEEIIPDTMDPTRIDEDKIDYPIQAITDELAEIKIIPLEQTIWVSDYREQRLEEIHKTICLFLDTLNNGMPTDN